MFYIIQVFLFIICIFAIITGLKYTIEKYKSENESENEKVLTEKDEAEKILKQLNKNKKVRLEFDRLVRKEKLKKL